MSRSLPTNMRAVVLNGETNKVELHTETTIPQPAENEHLIKVHATAITNGELDWGKYVKWPKYQVTTYDVAGTIQNSVPGSPFKPGDEIYARTDALRMGMASEYAIVLPKETALKPKNISVAEAASVPMSAETAWQALFTQAKLQEPTQSNPQPAIGKRILITAASGGCGIFAVQFAKLFGATVVGTCGPDNRDFVLGLGADDVINYRTTSIKDYVGNDESKKFDVVLEFAGRQSLQDAWYVVTKGGVLINITPGTFKEPERGVPAGVKGWTFIMESNGEQLSKISKYIESGDVKVVHDNVYSFEEYEKAFQKADSGHARGKVIIKP